MVNIWVNKIRWLFWLLFLISVRLGQGAYLFCFTWHLLSILLNDLSAHANKCMCVNYDTHSEIKVQNTRKEKSLLSDCLGKRHLSWDLDIGKVLVKQCWGTEKPKGSCGKYQHVLLIERRPKGLEVSDQEGESQGGFLKTRQEMFEWRSIMDRIVPPLSPNSYFEVLTPSTSECDYIWK